MKKILAAILVCAMFLALAACGSQPAPAATPTPAAGGDNAPSQNPEPAPAEISWPNGKDVYFEIGARAGGGTDMMIRFLTTPWATQIDGNIVVNNYDTSEIASQNAKNAKPDGLTLTMCSIVNMDNYLTGVSEVNPLTDYTVVGKFTSGGPQVLVAKADAPFDDLAGLAEYASAHPGELLCGVGLGTASHMLWINLAEKLGNVELNYVQSGAEADKMTNLAAGSIDLTNCSLNNAKSYEEAGNIKVLGILSPSDSVGKDDFDPTLSDSYLTTWEQGVMGASWPGGGYICAPAGMDPALLQAIYDSMVMVENDPDFIAGMATMSQQIEFKGPEEAAADFADEFALQDSITQALGINVRH